MDNQPSDTILQSWQMRRLAEHLLNCGVEFGIRSRIQ